MPGGVRLSASAGIFALFPSQAKSLQFVTSSSHTHAAANMYLL
jgi:hypothetical protein